MTEAELRRLLPQALAPGELDAEGRTWAVVRAAYEEAEPARERRWPTRPLLALAAVLALVAAAVSPPGRAVGGWIRDRVAGEEEAGPALVSLPAPGRLLVTSATGAWVVQQDGSKRRLGPYGDASWSPHGLYVVVTRGPRLTAVTPKGAIRWTITRPPAVRDPRWSPSGYRIAYRRGSTLRVVAGDGSPDRLLARGVAPIAAEWKPRPEHVLAFADLHGRIHLVNTDTRAEQWRTAPGAPVRRLAWSADGERLYVGGATFEAIYTGAGRLVRRDASPAPTPIEGVAFAPRGHRLARAFFAVREDRATVDVANVDTGTTRAVLSVPGRFRQLAWSPDGRWLLVTAPRADQWLFLRTSGAHEIRTVSNVAREFDPGGSGLGRRPRIAGWCCAPSFG